MKVEKVDTLVIGAGPSGTVAASIVNKNGFNVKIVEKQKFPRFVIGESLLPRCMEALDEAGFLEAVKEAGFQQKFGAKFVNGNKVCDFNFEDGYTKGWGWTWQVPRDEFDTILANKVQEMGVPIEFESGVTDIKFEGSKSFTTIEDSKGGKRVIEADFIIDASGYGRVIPRMFNLDKPSDLPPRKTLFTHIKDKNRMNFDDPNRIIIIVHEPQTWIWVIPFSNGNTSVGYVGNPEFFDKFKGSPEECLRAMIARQPYIAERFKDAEFVFEPKVIQGWSVTTNKLYGDGFVLTGNATEFLDPVFSSGVTLATASGHLAGKLVSKQLKGEKVDWQKEFVNDITQGVDTFRSYVNGWYDQTLQNIFFSNSNNDQNKSQICSVLAGYVWDNSNPFVKKHDRVLKTLAEVIRLENTRQ